MVSCDNVTVWVDNNFRERLARLTCVFNVLRVTKRGRCGAKKERRRGAFLAFYRLSSTLSTNLGNAM